MRIFVLLAALMLSGCAASEEGGPSRTSFATTIDPFRSILEPVVGERAEVFRILPSGASPHTYEPRPSDMRRVAASAALLYGAPALDGWAARLGAHRSMALIDLVPDSLQLPATEHHHGTHDSVDPHFWMDPLVVSSLLPGLAESLCSIDAGGCPEYRDNASAFARRLHAVHESLATAMEPVRGSSVLVSHPFLQYFLHRYGMRQAGVIEEIPGSEPTPRDMERMVRHARTSDARAIFTQPQLPARAAAAVAEVVGLPVVELNPLDVPTTYEELLFENARRIRTAIIGAEPSRGDGRSRHMVTD